MSLKEFWSHKEQELKFLEKYAGPVQARNPPENFESFCQSVRVLRKRILLHQVEKTAGLFETSPVGIERYMSPGGPVKFAYQRYDLRRVDIDWLQELYFIRVEGRFIDGLFFACGMSAIGALFSVFARRNWKRVQFSPTPYFESFLLGQRFFEQIAIDQAGEQFSSDRDVLWLDTVSSSWPTFPECAGSLRMIVVDTTCVEPNSPKVVQWIAESARLQCPLVLVRSHMKLDSFGVELGRLGSAVVVAPEHSTDDIESLVLELIQARTGFGTAFNLVNLYPWLGNPEFARLTRLRTVAIREVTRRLGAALLEERQPGDKFEVLPTTHGIFLVIRTHLGIRGAENCQDDMNTIQSNVLSRSIAEYCSERGLPAISASSFGFDQITLLDFVNMHDSQHHLRVSGADIPHSLIPEVAATIRKFITVFASRRNETLINH